MPEESTAIPAPSPLKLLPVAEIRASIQARRSQYPVALNGLNVRSLHFYEDPDTGLHRRRYVPGGGDPEKGVFPLEQARGDMAELQHAGNAAHLITWEFYTAEEYAAAEQQKREAIASAEAREQARVEALAKARADEAKAAERVGVLEKPGAVADADRVKGAETPHATGKKNTKLSDTLNRIGGK